MTKSPTAKPHALRRGLPILLPALATAVIAGLLAHADGANLPAAILTAGGAFGGTVALLLQVARYVDAGLLDDSYPRVEADEECLGAGRDGMVAAPGHQAKQCPRRSLRGLLLGNIRDALPPVSGDAAIDPATFET